RSRLVLESDFLRHRGLTISQVHLSVQTISARYTHAPSAPCRTNIRFAAKSILTYTFREVSLRISSFARSSVARNVHLLPRVLVSTHSPVGTLRTLPVTSVPAS